jgi:hypothetical protein
LESPQLLISLILHFSNLCPVIVLSVNQFLLELLYFQVFGIENILNFHFLVVFGLADILAKMHHFLC